MRHHLRMFVLLMAGALVLGGCVSFPESGSVTRGIEGAPEPEAISLVAEDPQPEDSPEQIVRGFLAGAAAGTTDDFSVARLYLSDRTAEVWNPGAEVTIYSGADPLEVEDGAAACRTHPDEALHTGPTCPYMSTTLSYGTIGKPHELLRRRHHRHLLPARLSGPTRPP